MKKQFKIKKDICTTKKMKTASVPKRKTFETYIKQKQKTSTKYCCTYKEVKNASVPTREIDRKRLFKKT